MGNWNKRNEMMIKIIIIIKKALKPGYPPGYECGQEWKASGFLLGIGTILSFRFFFNLYQAYGEVVYVKDGRKFIMETAAKPFSLLARGQEGMFVPFFLFLAAMSLYHYFYYYRGTKSIYLMRRLPKRAMAQSCIRGPALCMTAGAVFMAVLRLLYYLIYLLVIPAQCLPG